MQEESKEEKQHSSRESRSNSSIFGSRQVKADAKRALIGGGLTALATFAGAWMVGEVSGGEAHLLLQVALSTTRSFCGTVTLATGNILALMLTLLGLSTSSGIDLKWTHYQRIKQIAWADTITLVGAILIYLLLNFPLEESDPKTDPADWLTSFYYATLVLASILGGAVITVILMLYNAIKDMIMAMSPRAEERPSHIINASDEEDED
ncbi:MAG TPA: hypothetical protein VF181_08195 [Balneolaceae bacterium]